MSYQPKVALVHDDFIQNGGAEMLFAEIASIFPYAPVYTSLVNWSKIPKAISPDRIITSFIQKVPFAKFLYKAFLPVYPLAFESFNFSDFNVVISSTTRFAKSAITKPQAIHICYANSVPRFIWEKDKQTDYLPNFIVFFIKPYFKWLARWDKTAAQRVDFYIANSKNVQKKIKKYYGRESVVVYPFADTDFYKPKVKDKSENYFLVVSRLVKWKKIDIAIKTASDLGVDLKIVGSGPDESRLKSISGSEKIKFLSGVSKKELRELYQNANALIVTQDEDFGIAAVEAQSCGIPVIAYANGGSAEIIINMQTGLTFKKQTPKSLKDAIRRASIVKWDNSLCRKNALKFTKTNFAEKLKDFVNNAKLP